MADDVQPGPVAQKVALDLAWLRVPDLSDFPQQQVSDELAVMFHKSGLKPEWLAWLQQAVRATMLGLVVMETARPQDLPADDEATRAFPQFFDVQRIRGIFREQLVVITNGPPHFRLVDEVRP